ncbi:MAG TPA: restriction endonuclease subunit S [Blastocatellia bacterium]|nr:restriction endonuclease subunit S [Blastocatellia bacterium]
MVGEWQELAIGDLADLHTEQVNPMEHPDTLFQHFSIPAFDEGQKPALQRGSEIASHKFSVPEGAILVSKLNPRFPRVWEARLNSGLPAVASTEFLVLRPRGRTSSRFLKYLCLSPTFFAEMETRATGTSGSHQRVRPDDLLSIKVRVPPLPEQRAIAYILGALDDKIELNRKMSQTLEQMARALFKAWFVDFEPVGTKMEGRWRRGESLPGLPAHLYDLFPERLVPSELGEIPEGWKVTSLPDLVEINPPRPLRKGEMAPYLDMANMPTRGHAPDAVVDRPFGSGMRFINGDTLVARITPCLENGKTAFVDFLRDGQVGWGSTEYIVLRPRPPLPEEFAYCLARSEAFREFAIQSMTGTSGRQRVQADSLQHFRLPRVPAPVAEAFGRAIKPLFARSSAAVRESRTLAALRDALLPKLISGGIRVRDAERVLSGHL